jgi:hypothetical protein
MNIYEIRTPFGADGESFHKAMSRIKRESIMQLLIRPKWLRGRDKKSGRFHYWEVEDRNEAMAFLFAFGDQITEKERENHVESIEKVVREE